MYKTYWIYTSAALVLEIEGSIYMPYIITLNMQFLYLAFKNSPLEHNVIFIITRVEKHKNFNY